MGETQGALPLDPTKGSSTLWTPFHAIGLVTSACYARVPLRRASASPFPPQPCWGAGDFLFPKTTKKAPLTLANQGLIGIRQRLILPGRVQPSTFSTGELNFCVRDGNRWNLSVIATGNGSYLIASTFSFLPFRKRRVEDPCTLTTAHRMILQTVPISSQFSVSDLLSLACVCCLLRFLFLRFLLCFAAFPLAILIFSFQALNEAFDRLVSSSYTPYSASTDDLSTW